MKTNTKMKTVSLLALGMTCFAGPAIADPQKRTSADTDGDGQITLDEYLAQARERFAKIDTDNDGVITKEEAQSLRGKMRKSRAGKRKGGPQKDPANLFVDRNEDGVVTIEDVPKRAARLFKRADQNQDGSISVEENEAFQARAAEHREKRGEKKGRKDKKGKKGRRAND